MRQWILQFLWWLGFFLFWMNYLEQAVSSLTNWWFKNLLKKFTSSVLKSFWSWILITTILQSSNVVSVLVLAFVWTWILSLTSALAVILWSNIGTMITSSVLWIVWLSLNVSMLALPLIFLGAMWLSFLSRCAHPPSNFGRWLSVRYRQEGWVHDCHKPVVSPIRQQRPTSLYWPRQ